MCERSIIYNKNGDAIAECHVEYNGTWMGTCIVTADVSSPVPIQFGIGDYIIYRNERFVLYYDPTVVKKATRGTYGEGFKYSGIRFYALSNELTQVRFRDIVLADNHIHYTSLPQFSFYAETVDDLADRLQANTNRWCEENNIPLADYWVFITPNHDRSIERGVTEAQYVAAYGADASFYTEGQKSDVVVDVSNITVWEGMAFFKEKFGLNFITRDRMCIVGSAGIPTTHLFKYGKGNGLYEIERTADSEQNIVTKLTAYGAEDNMPIRYYATIEEGLMPNNMAINCLMLPGFPKYSLSQLCRATYDSVTDKTVIEIRKTPNDVYNTLMEIDGNHVIGFSTDKEDPYLTSPNITELGVKEGTISFVEENDDNGLKKIYPSIEGMTVGDVEGTSSTERLDEIYSCEIIRDNGVFGEGDTEPSDFVITLKNLGFDLLEAYEKAGSQMVISMKDGYCGGREFTVNAISHNNNGTWACTVSRVKDDLLDLYFPYSYNASIGETPVADEPYQIRAGDHFVLTGIYLDDTVYIWAASVRLLRNSITWLLANDYTRYTYLPRVDEIFMARQHDTAIETGSTSLHDTIKEGDIMLFEDADLGIDGSVYIDTLKIKENGNSGIPTYEVTLRSDKQVGTLQRIQNQINSLSSFVNNGGGGYTAAQIRGFIQAYGAEYFLSKLTPDKANSVITFLQGLRLGDGLYGIDGNGDANLNEGIFNKLTAQEAHFFNLIIDEVKSVGGQFVITPANCTIDLVEEDTATVGGQSQNVYKCYFRASDGNREIVNEFAVGDQALHYEFDVEAGETRNYWRLVVGKSSETVTKEIDGVEVDCHWILLSESDCKPGSDEPMAGDSLSQLGHRTDVSRQNAIIISAYNIPFIDSAPYLGQTTGIQAPLFASYTGINSYDIEQSNRVNVIAGNGNRFKGQVNVLGGSTMEDGRPINEIGTQDGNLLRNTYFGGDYESEPSTASTVMDADTPLWSDPLKHWAVEGDVAAADYQDAKSGRCVSLADGGISQDVSMEAGEWYILSFYVSGSSLTVEYGGVSETVVISSTAARHNIAFVANGGNVSFSGVCILYDIILTKGTIPVEWARSPLDPTEEKAMDVANDYLRHAISEASTSILGGLVLSQIIKVGNYRIDEANGGYAFTEETGGMSGARNHDNSPYLWGGGTMEQAIHTIDKYKNDPAYTPTDEELENMAKFVVTHGGRAILNDVVLRGYIYALGGLFKGNIDVGSNGDHFILDGLTNVFKVTGPDSCLDEPGYPPDPTATIIDLFKIFTQTDADTLSRIARIWLGAANSTSTVVDAQYGVENTSSPSSAVLSADRGVYHTYTDPNTGNTYKAELNNGEIILTMGTNVFRIDGLGIVTRTLNGTTDFSGALYVDENGFLKISTS